MALQMVPMKKLQPSLALKAFFWPSLAFFWPFSYDTDDTCFNKPKMHTSTKNQAN